MGEALSIYRAVVLIPHVPNPVSLSDLYTMRMPIFTPAEPYIYRFLWDFAEPFAGPNARYWRRDRAPSKLKIWPERAAGAQSVTTTIFEHPYDPLDFLDSAQLSHARLAALAYWYQYTEFADLPAPQFFVGVPSLLAQFQDFSAERAADVSRRMHVAASWRAS